MKPALQIISGALLAHYSIIKKHYSIIKKQYSIIKIE